ncbi:MAG: hypothetical protein ING19_08075 [Azospirillum sp.]|nr:hypothetical protein [Azospirillum sp.]
MDLSGEAPASPRSIGRLRRIGEGLAAAALALVILAGSAEISLVYMRQLVVDTKNAATAEQARRMANAVSAFVVANQATLLAETGGVGGVTFRTFPQLQAAPVAPIPASFVNSNAYRHGYVLLVSQPTAGTLLPILRTYAPAADRIPQGNSMAVAQRIGASGGVVDNILGADPARMLGVGGGWSIPRASFAALDGALTAALGAANWPGAGAPDNGVLAMNLSFADGGLASSSNWLARVDVGNVELNTMRTTLRVAGGSDIVTAATGTTGVSRIIAGQNGTLGSDIQMNGNDILASRNIEAQDVTLIDKARSLAQAVQHTFSVAPGTTIAKTGINCARGTLADQTPRIDVAAQSLTDSSGRIWSGQDVYAVDNGPSWTVRAELLVPSGGATAWVDADATFSRIFVTLRCQ